MSCSEDEREDFGTADEHSLIHGKLACYLFIYFLASEEEGPSP